jgi:hypothetical protein
MDIPSPCYDVQDLERYRECETVFGNVAKDVVRQAISVGWRESEVAMALADAFDGYVMYLAARPKPKFYPANRNETRVVSG